MNFYTLSVNLSESPRNYRSVGPIPRLKLVTESRQPNDSAGSASLTFRTDDELMLLARGGVAEAFDVLVRRHQQRLLRVAARYLGNPAQAADATQEALVAVLRSLPTYKATGKFTAYVYRILLNQCRMVRRSQRTSEQAHVQFAVEMALDANQVLEREQHRDIERALLSLSDKLRSVVVLRFAADLNYDEIGETLNIPTGTVKRRVFEAKAKLRETMEEP